MLLEAQKLAFAYHAGRPVLREISLGLTPGRIVALLGPNGSGKSTLLRLLLGQLRPNAGAVVWDGRPMADWRPRQLAQLVAYLPQSPMAEAGQSVGQILHAGRTPYLPAFGVESERDHEVVERTARRLGLADLMDQPLEELSGGQRQRVFIGRALAQEPRALLLDEPSTFLDIRHQAQLAMLLRELAVEQNLAILAASHDLTLAASFADELILLGDGVVAAAGTPDHVLDPGLLSKVYGVAMTRLDRAGLPPVIVPLIARKEGKRQTDEG